MIILYKYLSDENIAKVVADGVYRFYELTKYIKMEDEYGRSDTSEGSVSFEEKESLEFPKKLPIGRLVKEDGSSVSFSFLSMQPDHDYLKQYFVLCLSNCISSEVMNDSKNVVEITSDVFDFLERLFLPPAGVIIQDGRKMFSHGRVFYYDIHNHPGNISNEMWKQVFLKHRRFQHQDEYRASLFVSDKFFNRVSQNKEIKNIRNIHSPDGKKLGDAQIEITSGYDADGWRYIEIDTRNFCKKLGLNSSKIINL